MPYQQPYNGQALFSFLKTRATPGVEVVDDHGYKRSIVIDNRVGLLNVRLLADEDSYAGQIKIGDNILDADKKHEIIEKLLLLFDINMDYKNFVSVIKNDSLLYEKVKSNPGLRVPGCWDGFEIAIRAIVGQQISVSGASTIMGKLVQQFGDLANVGSTITHVFPKPKAFVELDANTLPMPLARAKAIRSLARQVDAGEIDFNQSSSFAELYSKMTAIKGIGPWTAHYVMMRVLKETDAFLEGDLVLQKNTAKLLGRDKKLTKTQLHTIAQAWRPWRAYASMHIWNL